MLTQEISQEPGEVLLKKLKAKLPSPLKKGKNEKKKGKGKENKKKKKKSGKNSKKVDVIGPDVDLGKF